MKMQMFQRGDRVFISKPLGRMYKAYLSGVEAIVIGSYADKYGGDDHNNYTLFVKGKGQCSWYDGECLVFLERGRTDMLKQWEDELTSHTHGSFCTYINCTFISAPPSCSYIGYAHYREGGGANVG